jgi:tetratricopeptide (TPR) repeat protein
VSINVLMYTPPVMSASQQYASETPNQDRDLREAGLETLASRSRGTLFRVAANPQYVFDRVRSEISAHYMLGVEPVERDRDGRAHQIRVEVKRSGVQVRARRQVKYTVRTPNTWSRDVLMGRVLRSPSSSTELPMRVSTYTFRDETPGKVKVIVAAEISPESMEKELDVAVGYAIFDELGKAVVGGQERKIYSANSDLPLRYEIALGVDPGQYRLRIAAIDLAGKSGSVERDVAAFGMGNHEFALGDLILSAVRQGKGGDVRAPVILRIGDGRLATFTEFYTNKPGVLDDTDVRFEIAASEDGAALQSTLAQLSERTDKTLRQATSVMPVGALPPGRYLARAVFTRGSKTVGKLTRPFEVLGTGLSTAAPPDSPGAKVDAAGERSAVRDTGLQVGVKLSAFKKEDALTGEMLRATFDVIDKNHPAVKAATARARTGKIEGTAMLALDAGEQSAGSILRGIELLQKGQLDPAANQFNVALRTPADAPLASFFLGVCYAAVGRDKEAVAAWERARAAQLSVPSLHSFLASGLLRLGQPAQALEPLRISLEREPQNDDIRRNLAIAQSFVGLQSDALSTITPFLDRNPSDADALLVALHALYQLRVDGKSAGSAADDTARAASYARAYEAAKGPHGALVDKWVEFMQQPR